MSAAFFKPRLLAPGPVEVPPAVLEALARPVTHHRAPAFRETFLRARERLATVFSVPGDDVLIVTGSGTAGFEAALVSAVPAGDRVLALHAGRFGERWAAMAESLGYQVEHLEAAPGAEFDLSEVAERLDATSQLAAVTLVQSETSTGALHDVRAVAELVRRVRPEALVLVDAVTSLACAELRPLEWGLDAVVSGSQKGVMTPPGLAFVWLSERAWQRSGEAGRAGSYYLDLHRERAKQAGGQTAFTPAVSLVAGLDVALGMLLDEGLENVWRRRAGLNAALLAAGGALGLRQFAARPSPAVAALVVPEGIGARAVLSAARARGATLAGGQGELAGTIIRPSLLGYADRYDAVAAAQLLEDALHDVDADTPKGVAVPAALRALAGEA
ncbi:MAG: alanine--glyoxylate aminotransferase family protein [Truepera sp.]|nr:alanine--glyoxylate aminotransferase family protein [Truepera sp.]HRQ10125.1 alanine--glyoxylate aminotransferase family protein [Trueperaceae bacterium]